MAETHLQELAAERERLAVTQDGAAPIRGRRGETIGVVLVFRDVTAALSG